MYRATAILLRNSTWKCGRVERLVVNYLRRQLQEPGCAQSSIKDMLEHFNVNEKQHHSFFEAMERLEKRGILKLVFNPFFSTDEFAELNTNGRDIIGTNV